MRQRISLFSAVVAFLAVATNSNSASAQINGDACGEGPNVVVFLHDKFQDSGSFSAIWEPVCSAQELRAIRYDRRGYGQSPASSEPYSNLVDLKTILDNLSISKVTLVASGTAAGLALEFTLQNPDSVNGVLLSSPSLGSAYTSIDTSVLSEISVPALVLIAANDTPDNIAGAQAVIGALPDATSVVMLSTSHYIELERPGAFGEYVLGFVAGLSP